jgi:hypothetical protein
MGVPHAVVIKESLEILAKPKSAIFKIASLSFVDHRIFSGYKIKFHVL